MCCSVLLRVSEVLAKRLGRQDSQSFAWKGRAWEMRITTYAQNAKMLWEAQRVIHQQNMQRLAELNRQAEQQKKAYEIKTQWVKSVDVMV